MSAYQLSANWGHSEIKKGATTFCKRTKRQIFYIAMQNVVVLSVMMLNVVMPRVSGPEKSCNS